MNRKPASIHTVYVPPIRGVPFPDEDFEPAGFGDPQEARDRLESQAVARAVLPFIDTRAAHWRYYLFAAPPVSSGRPIAVRRKLLRVLEQTQSRSGIGRREYGRFALDGRRSEARLLDLLERRYSTAYGSATSSFWGLEPEQDGLQSPSSALVQVARNYVIAGAYDDFFADDGRPSKVRHLFRARLVGLRRALAEHIIHHDFDLEDAAIKAVSSRSLDDSELLLFFSWALLQAYFGIADDGTIEDAEDESDEDTSGAAAGDAYFRTLARASLGLLDRLETPGELTKKQVMLIRTRLRTALQHKGAYQPPVIVWKLKNDGRRRRVFASLRLFAFARLLRATSGGY